jgi:hypothetical protein
MTSFKERSDKFGVYIAKLTYFKQRCVEYGVIGYMILKEESKINPLIDKVQLKRFDLPNDDPACIKYHYYIEMELKCGLGYVRLVFDCDECEKLQRYKQRHSPQGITPQTQKDIKFLYRLIESEITPEFRKAVKDDIFEEIDKHIERGKKIIEDELIKN